VPRHVPQYTFQEACTLAIAAADAPSGRRWLAPTGEMALAHMVEGWPLATRFQPSPNMLAVLTPPITRQALWDELHRLEFPAILLLHVSLALVLEGHDTVPIDDLLQAIGWTPRTGVERDTMRRKVWRWLLFFDSVEVRGLRTGTYKDRRTGQVLNLTSVDALLRITGKRQPVQTASDPSEPPLEVSFTAGPWLKQFRGNRQILTDFGEIRRIAAIPSGKVSGAWAQSIGLALQQRWRERAFRASIEDTEQGGEPSVCFQSFTRRDLLGLFRCPPYVDDVLASDNPARARQYWDKAISLLQEAGVIGYYQERTTLRLPEKGWSKAWLKQPLDIRPAADEMRSASEIASARTRGSKKRKLDRP